MLVWIHPNISIRSDVATRPGGGIGQEYRDGIYLKIIAVGIHFFSRQRRDEIIFG